MAKSSVVLVVGDLVQDRHLYLGSRPTLGSISKDGTHLVDEVGGAALTHRLLLELAKLHPVLQEQDCQLGCEPPEIWPEGFSGFATWASRPGEGNRRYWRLEKALGYGPRSTEGGCLRPNLKAARPAPDVLVLDDAGDTFRQKSSEALWRLDGPLPKWIVLKLAGSVGRGALWDTLMQRQPKDRLVILASARLLREEGIRLSKGLSWERTTEHLVAALDNHPALAPLREARHLVIDFESEGAVWFNLSDAKPALWKAHLIFDADNVEGEWSRKIKEEAFGYRACLAASVSAYLATFEDEPEPDLRGPIAAGLWGIRNLRQEGHGCTDSPGLGFPAPRLAEAVHNPTPAYAHVSVPWQVGADSRRGRKPWTILGDIFQESATHLPLFGFARQLAIKGEPALEMVPHMRLGNLLTADRGEMESLRALRRILESYKAEPAPKSPRCIGVFGAPGSGKSFGVRELAAGVFGNGDGKPYEGWMEFNLSQFNGAEDLIGAFHQVRDKVLQGFVPVVFWDEFDSQELEWLRSLLAPMQDGRFQEGESTHTLGKCVFIFAGGTAHSFDMFGENIDETEFRNKKGPDFKSRLDDFLNIAGPNPIGNKGEDIFFPVRRALLIRALLGVKPKETLEIDHGLLTALLHTKKFTHGARSLQKLLEPLRAARAEGHLAVRLWRLPAPSQMTDHVNALKFHRICAEATERHADTVRFQTDEIIDLVAPDIHRIWRVLTPNSDHNVDFAVLADVYKKSNRAAARRIPENLALIGMRLERKKAKPEEILAVREQLRAHLEFLAEAEHRGWVEHLQEEGWTYAAKRDDPNQKHNCLKPFQELLESNRRKDRAIILHYPDFVDAVGFRIVEDRP